MAIMHTQMIGLVNSDLDIVKDENNEEICCTFTMLVKEKERRMPFTVYISNKDLIKRCEDEITNGSTVLVNGIIEINFHDILQMGPSNGRRISIPVITSNLTLVCNEIYVMFRKCDKEYIFARREAAPFSLPNEHEEVEYGFDLDKELPF